MELRFDIAEGSELREFTLDQRREWSIDGVWNDRQRRVVLECDEYSKRHHIKQIQELHVYRVSEVANCVNEFQCFIFCLLNILVLNSEPLVSWFESGIGSTSLVDGLLKEFDVLNGIEVVRIERTDLHKILVLRELVVQFQVESPIE